MRWKEVLMKARDLVFEYNNPTGPTEEEKRMADKREVIEAELRADGYDDPDIIEFEIDLRLGLIVKEKFDSI